ncbi:MAG: hypothetical protein ABIR34_04530, partial [Marmoricola sp.]
ESVDHAIVAAERAQARLASDATIEREASQLRIRCSRGAEMAPGLVQDLAETGVPARRIEVAGPTLDDVFLDLTGRSLRESNDITENTENTDTQGAAA